MLKRRKANGFTLIELVVVIAVLGILAGIAIARYLDLTEEADRNACLANRTTLSRELAYREAEGDDPQTYYDQQVTNALTTTPGSTTTEGSRFRCPSGGTYTLNAQTLAVTCSIPTHSDGSIGNSTVGNGTGTGGGSTGGGGTGVDTSKLVTSTWSDFLAKAAAGWGSTLTKGSVFTDSTGTYFVYDGSWISKESAEAKPTLEEAAAANLGVAKINLDSYLTSANQGTDGKKTIWTTLPTRGTVYSNGTDYYVYRETAENTNAYTGVDVENSKLWLKISK
jgi:prepilin-type N-terminal cleavage/methylation domain-containing protein